MQNVSITLLFVKPVADLDVFTILWREQYLRVRYECQEAAALVLALPCDVPVLSSGSNFRSFPELRFMRESQ